MPAFEAGRGRLLLDLPQTEFSELQDASDAYTTLVRERKVTQRRRASLRTERERAIERDRKALAKAIAQGKPDPQDKTVERIDKEIRACDRRLEALEVAIDDAEVALIAVVDENRQEWVEAEQGGLNALLDDYLEAIDALAEVRSRVSSAHALIRWLHGFPETESTFRTAAGLVLSLRAANGEPYTFDQVVEAMREDVRNRPTLSVSKSETQRIHEERRANEESGRGYFTDAELKAIEEDPVGFFGGRGAEVIRPMRDATRDESAEGPVVVTGALFIDGEASDE
jgi:hypothetical protein